MGVIGAGRYFLGRVAWEPYGNNSRTPHTCLPRTFPRKCPSTWYRFGVDPRGVPPPSKIRKKVRMTAVWSTAAKPARKSPPSPSTRAAGRSTANMMMMTRGNRGALIRRHTGGPRVDRYRRKGPKGGRGVKIRGVRMQDCRQTGPADRPCPLGRTQTEQECRPRGSPVGSPDRALPR